MAKSKSIWYVGDVDGHTNKVISDMLEETVVGPSAGRYVCSDGEPRDLWLMPTFGHIRRLFNDRQNLCLKFIVFVQHPKRLPQNVHNFVASCIIKRRKKVYVQPTPPPPQEPPDF